MSRIENEEFAVQSAEEERKRREDIVSNIRENAFVEAGAGAGKTSLIVNRVVNQIKQGTVNIIRDGETIAKKHVCLPEKIVNIVKCKNPRCITSTEQELDQVFRLTDSENKVYRCMYCDSSNNYLP